MTDMEQAALLRLEQAKVHADGPPHRIYFQISEDEAADLASGYVPQSVKAMARLTLDQADEDRRRAERPVKPKKRA